MTSVLSVRNLSVGARLQGISLELGAGEAVAVVGRNGAGKSTLVSACLGLLRPDSGEVEVGGRSVAAMRPGERSGWLGWLPQRDAAAGGLSAVEVVAAARFRLRESQRVALREARAILVRKGLGAFAERPLSQLSGGERQRVRFAALEAQQARLWLLDEPGNHLDPAMQIALWSELAEAVHAGVGAMVITHDITLLTHLAAVPTRVVALDSGGLAWTLELADPELPGRLGELLGLRIDTVKIEDEQRFLVVGRR